MPRRVIARVEPFIVTGLPWTFVDIRTLNRRRQADARDLIITLATEISSSVRRSEPVIHCHEYEVPAAPIGTPVPEICDDAERPLVSLIATNNRGVPIGGIHVSDMRIERDDNILRVKARPSPGLPSRGTRTQFKVWGQVMRWLLENNLPLMNGKELDIVEWIMPRQREFRWTTKRRPELSEMFTEIEVAADRDSNPVEPESPTEYRRKGIPRP